MDGFQASKLLDELKDIKFYIVKVEPGVPKTASFSVLPETMRLEKHPHAEVGFLTMFGLTMEILLNKHQDKEIGKAVERLCSVLRNDPMYESLLSGLREEPHEGGRLRYTAMHVLHPLTESCTINKDVDRAKTTPKVSLPVAEEEHLGIGNEYVWHGNPDAMCNNVPIATLYSDSYKEVSSGILSKENKIMQVVGQAVVASFTSHNCYPTHVPMVPSIGITMGEFVVALYDCTTDVLLVLPTKFRVYSEEGYDHKGLVLLWALLHYRLFLNKQVCKELPDEFACSLQDQFRESSALRIFEGIANYNVASWLSISSHFSVGKRVWDPEFTSLEVDCVLQGGQEKAGGPQPPYGITGGSQPPYNITGGPQPSYDICPTETVILTRELHEVSGP